MAKVYKYYREETKEWEQVKEEKWQWEAVYHDGTILKQFGDDGLFHQTRELDQEKLFLFELVSTEVKQRFTLLFKSSSMKLLYFYRRAKEWNTNKDIGQMYCLGYKKNIKGVNIESFVFITPENQILITDDKEAVNF